MGNFTSTNPHYSVLNLDQQQDVRIAELTASSLSVLGSGSIIIAVILKRKVLNPEVYPLFHLSLADLLASIFVIVSLIIFGQTSEDGDRSSACAWTSSLAWGLYLTTFLLTLIYAFEAYRRTVDQLAQLVSPYYSKEPTYSCTPWYLPVAYTIAWVMPLLSLAVWHATQHTEAQVFKVCKRYNYECLVIFHRKNDPCLDRSDVGVGGRLAMKSFFITSFFLCSIGIVVFYYLTHKAVTLSQHSSGVVSHKQYEAAKRIRNRGILYCAVFIICWLPASIVGIITYTEVAITENLIVLFMMQGCIANLQGFLNCLIYGWIRGGFKSALNLYNVRGDRESFSHRDKKKRRSLMNYKTFTVYTDDEYDTLSDPEINKSRRPSPAEEVHVM
ncbi:transmembrane protein 116-like [Patiria miniata]|uniref:G-protein coupled receptors family 1 profile domain-containing protein n=1 Tax=Patiria miniata TaxID=46514 RepID=A0A913ZSI6_PATMI|nr:transmembrane protein 116-like [Patiria miniata]